MYIFTVKYLFSFWTPSIITIHKQYNVINDYTQTDIPTMTFRHFEKISAFVYFIIFIKKNCLRARMEV